MNIKKLLATGALAVGLGATTGEVSKQIKEVFSMKKEKTELSVGGENNINILNKKELMQISHHNDHHAQKIIDEIILKDSLDQATVKSLRDAINNHDIDTVEKIMSNISHDIEKNPNAHGGNNTLVLLMSAIALMRFAMMIKDAVAGKPISFIKHHAVFAMLNIVVASQIPGEVAHSLVESLIAYLAIMGITRMSRGITNKVDFSQTNEEEAKTMLYALGGLGSVMTTPASATIFSKLGEKLDEKDKYIAMHAIGNVEGGVLRGDFPFLYNWLKQGPLYGTLWQAGVMLPIMAFHKIYQAWLRKIGPAKIRKHRTLLRNALKGIRFDKKKLSEKVSIEQEEEVLLHEFMEHLKDRIEHEGGEEKNFLLAEVEQVEKDLSPEKETDLSHDADELGEKIQDVMHQPETKHDIKAMISELHQAIKDGKISQDDLESFSKKGEIKALLGVSPGLQHLMARLDLTLNEKFIGVMKKIKANHAEVEISKVFTVQALSVPVLIPIITTLLEAMPGMMEGLASSISSVADNYAATAITRSVDNAKAITFGILAGALTIYGNMANLSFLGKSANFMQSVRMAKYMIPTMFFAYGMLNSDKITHSVSDIFNAPQKSHEIPYTPVKKDNQSKGITISFTDDRKKK